MSGLSPNLDHMAKQEQYKDLLREAERYRLIKAIAQPRPRSSRKVIGALRKPAVRLRQYLPGLKPISRARI